MTPTNVRGLYRVTHGDKRWIPVLCQLALSTETTVLRELGMDSHDIDALKKWARRTSESMAQ